MRKGTTTIIEFLPSLRTSDLKHWDTISNQCIAGKGNALLPFRVTYELTKEALILNYRINGNSLEQYIDIIIEASNLGIGKLWYFSCPVTKKKCRKLVLWNGKFVHQSSINHAYYRVQTESTPERNSKKWIRRYHKYQSLQNQQMSPYYKPTYAGNYTRTAVRAWKALLRYADAINNEKEVWAWIDGTRNTERKY